VSDRAGDFKGIIKTEYIKSTPWWPEKKTTPKNAPNILYILLDDAGFADVGCYGSLIETPNIDRLAADGLRYQNFHVNPMCSPTRASLLSGCNHHAVGMGYLANFSLGFPGYRGCVDKKYGMISETLVENGYNTFALGKWHLTNDEKSTPAGPFDEWPLGRGFNKYYGFLGACTNQFYPQLVCGNEFVDQPKAGFEGYHLSEDLTAKAITYIGDSKSNAPDKPFFCYLAYGAQHSPLQVPTEYIERYKGKFDEGWHAYRRKVFARQKEIGIIPENAALADDDYFVESWNSCTEAERRVLAKYMEVYAGFVTHTDAQIGRIIDYIKKIGQYENTLVVFLTDNGASAEGTPWGTTNTIFHYLNETFTPVISEEESKKLGTEDASCHYPTSWAHASNTPLKMYKSWSHNGGIKVPMIISYPGVIKDKGGIRSQYHHVVDINKTVLDICGIEEPESIKGVAQEPKHGISMTYSFDQPEEPTHRHVQYYEMLGNRGIWADGWKAVTDHVRNPSFDFSTDVWELYDTNNDFSESVNLADQYPEKLKELVEQWYNEAGKYSVLPLLESHMKKAEGYNSKAILRFAPSEKTTHYTIYPEATGLALTLRGSYTMTVFTRYKKGDEGVLISNGDNLGGYALYIQDGKLNYHYNWLSFTHFSLTSAIDIPEGARRLAFDFVETHPNCGVGRLLIDGKPCGSMLINSKPLFATHFGRLALGRFSNISVTGDMKEKKLFRYTNIIEKAEIDLSRPLDDMDMMLKMEEELRRE
jgi:arylsulfatase